MSKLRLFFVLAIVLIVGACSLMPVTQVGDVPSELRLNAIKPGKHTKEDVSRLIGSPAHITLFEKESWVYIEQQEKNRAFLPPKELERKIAVVTFKRDGVVEKVSTFTLGNGRIVTFDDKETQTTGKDLSAWEELIGNFGRFPGARPDARQ